MKKKELKEVVLKVSEGIIANLTDLVLAQLFFGLEFSSTRQHTLYDADKALERTYDDLTRINYQQIKQTIYYLKRKGLVKYIKREKILLPKITTEGKRRLENLIPVYDARRIWDKRIYLVAYDIPETKKKDRDVFRRYLKRIGCGLLQASVWLTLYNPKEILREFIKERGLKGQVLISDLGEDGSIGEEDLKELVARVYDLDKLDQRYLEFYQEWRSKNKLSNSEKARINFSFYSILTDDPQLPFDLLPEDWIGDKAYKLLKKLV